MAKHRNRFIMKFKFFTSVVLILFTYNTFSQIAALPDVTVVSGEEIIPEGDYGVATGIKLSKVQMVNTPAGTLKLKGTITLDEKEGITSVVLAEPQIVQTSVRKLWLKERIHFYGGKISACYLSKVQDVETPLRISKLKDNIDFYESGDMGMLY